MNRNRVWSVKKKRKAATINLLIFGENASSRTQLPLCGEESGENIVPVPPLIHVMKHTVPSGLALVMMKYQADTDTLLLKNAAKMWTFVAATFIYWLIVGEMKRKTSIDAKLSRILSVKALAFGILSMLSLVSMFIPCSGSIVLLLIWIPLPLISALPIIHDLYSVAKRGLKCLANKITWDSGCKFTEEVSLPV